MLGVCPHYIRPKTIFSRSRPPKIQLSLIILVMPRRPEVTAHKGKSNGIIADEQWTSLSSLK